ncbi:MAG: hypothetical protein EZS28_016841 [Streblomastix strix]|uniref:Uncharacterized protein n=1 Tax=Streblomastix strix TaxID=222440 RepID=A0A5J4VYM3_9EUKA|nr:MAG: hypothetical protein EZS28_016841 [Streblomastix strix]
MGVPETLINCSNIEERDQKATSSQMKSYKQNQHHFNVVMLTQSCSLHSTQTIYLERKILCEKNRRSQIMSNTNLFQLAAQGFDGRTINVFTHHTPDLKMNKKVYIFAANKEQDSLASALVKNQGEKQATQIISQQRLGARVSEGDGLQQYPLGDDLLLSPQETLASPLSLPIISTQPIVETQSPNDHKSAKVQQSQKLKNDQDVEPQKEAQNQSITKDSD